MKDYLELLIEFIDAIVWPLLILFALVQFKRPLINRFDNISRFKLNDLEVEFAKELEKIKKQTDKASTGVHYDLINLASTSPILAINKAWNEISQLTEKIALSIDPKLDLDVPTKYKLIEKVLQESGKLDTKKIKILRELRILRNKVMHAENFEVSEIRAVEFVNISLQVMEELKRVIEK